MKYKFLIFSLKYFSSQFITAHHKIGLNHLLSPILYPSRPKIGNKINYFGVNMRITILKKFVFFF